MLTTSLLDHLVELRRRIIISLAGYVVVCVGVFLVYDGVVIWLCEPLRTTTSSPMVVHGLYDGLSIRIKLSLLGGCCLATPLWIFQGIRFVFPGLRPSERRFMLGMVLTSSLLLVTGFLVAYHYLVPLCIRVMTDQAFIPEGIGIIFDYRRNVAIVLQMLFYTMLVFQLPVVLLVLLKLRVLSIHQLITKSRWVVVGSFVVSALITPPDPVTQMGLAAIIIILYYATVGIAKMSGFGG